MEPKCDECGKSTRRCSCYKPTHCGQCGQLIETPREYHPYAACQLFKALRNSMQVRGNLKAVIEYGMKAQAKGVSVEDAMADFNKVL